MKIKIVNIAILLLTLCGTLVAISDMPDMIPVHFDISGVADRWGSKYEMLIPPGIMLLMLGFWFGCDATFRKKSVDSPDEKERAEDLANIKVLNITFTVVSVMFMILNTIFLYMSYTQLDSSAPVQVDIMRIATVVMGISFIALGNFMPKTRNNGNVGFRLPWTRYNDVTWNKCNRMGGIVLVVSGVVITLGALIFSGTVPMIIMSVAFGVSLVFLLIYAYVVYSNEVKKN